MSDTHFELYGFDSEESAPEFLSYSVGQELTPDRVLYDREEVLHKLLSDNSTQFSGDASLVDDIRHVINTEYKTDLDEIQDIARKAVNARESQSSSLYACGYVYGDWKLEKALYQPLVRIPLNVSYCQSFLTVRGSDFNLNLQVNIINSIDQVLSARLGGRKRRYYRQFVCTRHTPLAPPSHADPGDQSVFRYQPAFAVAERPRPLNGGAILRRPTDYSKAIDWRHLVSYMEVKSCVLDAPTAVQCASSDSDPAQDPGTASNINATLARATEYARSLLASLPFQLYVYGLILCGSDFWLTWTDRGGVVLSPQYSLLDDAGLRTFIRIVLRLTWELSPSELGQDPNTEYTEGHKSLSSSDYPDLLVKMPVGGDGGPGGVNRTWTTFGNPLWRSCYELFGRGTCVWQMHTDEGRPAALKVAWRPVGRTSELDIYRRIREIVEGAHLTIPGMVKLDSIVGGDVVHFTDGKGILPAAAAMTVSALRPQNAEGSDGLDMQLYRMVFEDIGKPLWRYHSPEELVRAMRMALVGTSSPPLRPSGSCRCMLIT